MSVKIRRLEIVSFGKLKNLSVNLDDGINLLSAPNESGKSTLAAFLRFVLYGYVDGKKQDLSENDKKLFTPWDNPKSEGSVFIEKDGKQYRISRSFLAAKESVEMVDVSNGNSVYGGMVPGVALLGLSEEVFSRTLFFRQLPSAQGKDSVIADQLQNLAVSADDQVSEKAAIDKLSKAKNELKGRILGSGILPKQEKEKADLDSRVLQSRSDWDTIMDLRKDLENLDEKLGKNKTRQEEVNSELENLVRWETKERVQMLEELQKKALDAENEYSNAAALIQTHGAEDNVFLAGLLNKNSELESTKNMIRMTKESMDQQEKVLQEKKPLLSESEVKTAKKKLQEQKMWVVSLGLFGLLFLVAGIVTCFFIQLLGFILVGIGLAGIAMAVLCHFGKKKIAQKYGCTDEKELHERIKHFSEDVSSYQNEMKKQTQMKEKLDELVGIEERTKQEIEDGIHSYRMEVGGNFSEQVQKLIVACTELAGLKTKAEAASATFCNALGNDTIDELKGKAEGANLPERPREKVEFENRFLIQQRELMSSQKNDKSITLATLEAKAEDPSLLESKRVALDQMIQRNHQKLDAYEAAKEGIQEAANYMKSMVAPHLGEIAEQYFAVSTNGKYQKLTVDTKLSMSTEDQGITRECDYLSAGTKDCVYLSLRLALVDLLFDGSGAPLILDDSFGRLDKERLQATIRMLGKAAQKNQILLLTCDDREEKALQQEKLSYKTVEGF